MYIYIYIIYILEYYSAIKQKKIAIFNNMDDLYGIMLNEISQQVKTNALCYT